MFFKDAHVDQNIVEINIHHPLCDQICEYRVHEALEGCWEISHPEKHHFGLKQPVVCGKSPFSFITHTNADVVIAPSYVELGKIVTPTKSIYYVVREQQRSSIRNSDSIQVSIILNQLQFPIFFLYEEHWRSQGRLGRFDVTFLQLFIQEFIKFRLLIG